MGSPATTCTSSIARCRDTIPLSGGGTSPLVSYVETQARRSPRAPREGTQNQTELARRCRTGNSPCPTATSEPSTTRPASATVTRTHPYSPAETPIQHTHRKAADQTLDEVPLTMVYGPGPSRTVTKRHCFGKRRAAHDHHTPTTQRHQSRAGAGQSLATAVIRHPRPPALTCINDFAGSPGLSLATLLTSALVGAGSSNVAMVRPAG